MSRRGCLGGVLAAIAAAGLVLASPSRASAQAGSSAGTRLTLADALAEVLAHAPALSAADAQERAARWKATAIERTRVGQVDAIGGVTRYQDDVIVRSISRQLFEGGGFAGLPFDRNQAAYGVTFQVPLYLGGRLTAAVDLADLQANELALAAQSSRWELRANATALYAAIQTFDAVAAAFDDNLRALDAARRTLSLTVDQGRRPMLDLLKLDDQIESMRADRSQAGADASRVRALLLALMGRDPAGPLDVDPLPDRPLQAIPDAAALMPQALASSPVQRSTLAVDETRRAVDLARGASRPTVVARGNWMGHAAPTTDPLSTWDVGVAISLPLFDGGARRAGVAAARETEQAAALALTRSRLDRGAQLVQSLAELDAAGTQSQAAQAGVAAAVEAARIEQIRYDAGAGTIEDLLRARAREVGARAVLARARGARVAAGARVNALVEREVVQ